MTAGLIQVHVRYFAAARAAAGAESETVSVHPGATLADLLEVLRARSQALSTVLARCSYLCDGMAVRGDSRTLETHQTIDVLPPFAGG
jgi:molybdopterin converting factor small subunit